MSFFFFFLVEINWLIDRTQLPTIHCVLKMFFYSFHFNRTVLNFLVSAAAPQCCVSLSSKAGSLEGWRHLTRANKVNQGNVIQQATRKSDVSASVLPCFQFIPTLLFIKNIQRWLLLLVCTYILHYNLSPISPSFSSLFFLVISRGREKKKQLREICGHVHTFSLLGKYC